MPLSLAWAAGRRLVSFTGIRETEGRTDFVGEDGEFSFGCVAFELHMGNPTSAVQQADTGTESSPGALNGAEIMAVLELLKGEGVQ